MLVEIVLNDWVTFLTIIHYYTFSNLVLISLFNLINIGENVFLDSLASSVVSKVIVSSGSTKACKYSILHPLISQIEIE